MTIYEYDLRFVHTALQEIEPYLLSDDLFWTLNLASQAGQPSYPKLTIGNLLLSMHRLKVHAVTPAQQAEFTSLDNRLYALSSHWQAAWMKKANREFKSRQRQWRAYLIELDQNPEKQAPYYPTEVRWRLLLDLLAEIMQGAACTPDSHDPLLYAYFTSGRFVWDEEDQAAFPQDPYWYLYGNIKAV